MEELDGQLALRKFGAGEDVVQDLEVEIGSVDDLLLHPVCTRTLPSEVDETP